MASRTRRRKPVNYKSLDGDDSDDDFNVPTPPLKRPRAQMGTEREAEFADGAGPSGVQLSREDKLFKKQLKVALERSVEHSPSSEGSSQEHSVKSADTLPVSEVDAPSGAIKRASSQESKKSIGGEDEWAADGSSGSSEEELSGADSAFSDEEEFKPKKNPPAKAAKAKTKAPAKKKPPAVKEKSADVDRSSDGAAALPKKQSWVAPPVLSPPAASTATAGSLAVLPPVLQAAPTSRLEPAPAWASPATTKSPGAASSSSGRAVLKAVNAAPITRVAPPKPAALTTPVDCRVKQKWTPPALVASGTPEQRILSPSGGGGSLRLGLSRNRKFKPLHPTARPVP